MIKTVLFSRRVWWFSNNICRPSRCRFTHMSFSCCAYFNSKSHNAERSLENRKQFENTYYKEFVKLLKRQRELPFIYTSTVDSTRHAEETELTGEIFDVIAKTEKERHRSPFESLGVSKHIESLLAKNGIDIPLPVQRKSLPVLFRKRSAIIESATGTGKTLTYLLPIVQDVGAKPCSNIIIVPTRELASQVYKEALKYVRDRSLVVRYVSGINEEHERKLVRALRESHIIVGTPKRLLEIFEQKNGHFRNVRRIVLDEVDKLLPLKSMFKENVSKVKPTEKLVSMLSHQNRRAQLIATSATVSRRLVEELQDSGFSRSCKVIKCNPAGYDHGMVPKNIRHNFVTVKDNDSSGEIGDMDDDHDGELDSKDYNILNKVKYIGRMFRQTQEKSILVFIPRQLSVQNVVDMFSEMQFTAVALYKQLLLPSPMDYDKFNKDFENGEIQIVVSTEETVRGLDFPFINQTFLTYVPNTPEDYLHVAGRVGRVNKQGTVTTVINESEKHSEKRRLKKRFEKLNIKGRALTFSL